MAHGWAEGSLLDMDLLSFNALCDGFHSVAAAEKLERLHLTRAAVWADEKVLKQLTRDLKREANISSFGAEEFIQQVGGFRGSE